MPLDSSNYDLTKGEAFLDIFKRFQRITKEMRIPLKKRKELLRELRMLLSVDDRDEEVLENYLFKFKHICIDLSKTLHDEKEILKEIIPYFARIDFIGIEEDVDKELLGVKDQRLYNSVKGMTGACNYIHLNNFKYLEIYDQVMNALDSIFDDSKLNFKDKIQTVIGLIIKDFKHSPEIMNLLRLKASVSDFISIVFLARKRAGIGGYIKAFFLGKQEFHSVLNRINHKNLLSKKGSKRKLEQIEQAEATNDFASIFGGVGRTYSLLIISLLVLALFGIILPFTPLLPNFLVVLGSYPLISKIIAVALPIIYLLSAATGIRHQNYYNEINKTLVGILKVMSDPKYRLDTK